MACKNALRSKHAPFQRISGKRQPILCLVSSQAFPRESLRCRGGVRGCTCPQHLAAGRSLARGRRQDPSLSHPEPAGRWQSQIRSKTTWQAGQRQRSRRPARCCRLALGVIALTPMIMGVASRMISRNLLFSLLSTGVALAPSQSLAEVTFIFDFADVTASSGTGFDDTSEGAARRQALQDVGGYIGGLLNHTSTITYTVNLKWSRKTEPESY